MRIRQTELRTGPVVLAHRNRCDGGSCAAWALTCAIIRSTWPCPLGGDLLPPSRAATRMRPCRPPAGARRTRQGRRSPFRQEQLRPDGDQDLAVEVTGQIAGEARLPQHGFIHGLQHRRLVQAEGAIRGAPEQPQRQLDDAVEYRDDVARDRLPRSPWTAATGRGCLPGRGCARRAAPAARRAPGRA